MPETHSPRWHVHQGDCLAVMRDGFIAPGSIDAVVCDPPYGLEFMGKEWDAPWKQGFAEFGMKDGDRRAAPVFGSKRNPCCRSCQKHKRGTKRCVCETPDFDETPATFSQSFGAWCETWATAALRVAKPGAHLLAFGGTRTFHRLTCALEDAGWEIRDCLSWNYGSGFPKSHNGPWGGTALKPSWEPVILARKPLIGTVAANFAKHGLGGLRIDECRIVGPTAIMREWESDQSLCASCASDAAASARLATPAIEASTAPSRVVPTTNGKAATRRDGTNKADTGCSAGLSPAERNGNLFDDSNSSIGAFGSGDAGRSHPGSSSTTRTGGRRTTESRICASCGEPITTATMLGRWPPNAAFDEEAARMLDEQSGECPAGASLNGNEPSKPGYSGGLGRHVHESYADSGGASRFFYCAKASRGERDHGLDGMPLRPAPKNGSGLGDPDSLARRVEATGHDAKMARNIHPTVKPVDLMRWLVRLVTPAGGTVLDPFLGSGTTGVAAIEEGCHFIGIEREAAYCDIAIKRLQAAQRQGRLDFNTAPSDGAKGGRG